MANCLHPVTIRNKGKGPAYIAVPCGSCPKCLATKLNKWVFRLKQHAKSYKYVGFVTLTYNDESLPYSHVTEDNNITISNNILDEHDIPCLNKDDLKYFFRKLRKYGKVFHNLKDYISYYAIGEYGSDTDRPHYHVMLFSNYLDFSKSETQIILECIWNYGFVDIKPVTDFRIQYVCKHHLKPKNSKWFPVKQFTLRSNGLGLSFLTDNTAKWFNDNKPNVIHTENGIKMGIPRYYRTKLLEIYGYDISSAYVQRQTPQQKLCKLYHGNMHDKVLRIRNDYELMLEEQHLYKSKNKRK